MSSNEHIPILHYYNVPQQGNYTDSYSTILNVSITELWEQYHKAIFRRLLCLVSDWHTAEDLLQEVYIKALRFPPKHDKNLYSWLYQIATNVVRDYRKQRRVPTFSYDQDNEYSEDGAESDLYSTRYDPDRYIATCDLQWIAFSRLSPERQRAMINYHILGRAARPDIGQIRDDLKDSLRRLERRVEMEVSA